jgi:GNAT superfamily N-acetyltransferase
MASPSNAQTFQHQISGTTLLPILRDLLPYPLPLYRRLQFPNRSEYSHVLATFPPSTSDNNSIGNKNNFSTDVPRCFAVGFVDRTRRPETEAWIFLSGEIPGRCVEDCTPCKDALISLTRHIATLPLPESVHAMHLTGDKMYLSHMANPDIILFGGLHSLSTAILKAAKLIPEELEGFLDYAYIKYLFQSSTLPASSDLPSGLHWDKVRRQDLALVRSRTSIPRQDATLSILPSLAAFPDFEDGKETAPIAWSFLGPDASLSSLHVEPEWRGKGLAKKLAAKLFREGSVGVFGAVGDEDIWAHADVALDNDQSRGVCKSLGGEEKWEVFWIRVDLGLARLPL